jgi:uncharacterized coiled-coil protein SlyX
MSSEFEEKFERHVEHMLQQQARFDESMRELREQTAANAQSIAELAQIVVNLAGHVDGQDDRLTRLEQLMEAQAEQSREQAERGKETDARLDSLILLFERHLTEGHSGGQ